MASRKAIRREEDKRMEVKFWGTRGSLPVASSDQARHGGNTTCVEVISSCLPENYRLVIDAGSGFLPFGNEAMGQGIKTLILFFTHYHHDHTQGLPLSGVTHRKDIRVHCYGPIEGGFGPREILEHIMRRPMFPVDFAEVASKFKVKGIDHPSTKVMVIHPKGGEKLLSVEDLANIEASHPAQVTFAKGRYGLDECLVAKMYYSDHPERTISYRMVEKPTGKVFVFLTDHENQAGFPVGLMTHVKDADLLVVDAQYTSTEYLNGGKSGFGHATPVYDVELAARAKVKRLGLTHHDPIHTDSAIDRVLEEAGRHSVEIDYEGEIFTCSDYQTVGT